MKCVRIVASSSGEGNLAAFVLREGGARREKDQITACAAYVRRASFTSWRWACVKLNRRQKAFADFYLECGNATEAARKAGYSENTASVIGAQNLRKLNISEYIVERMQPIEKDRIASADEVLAFFTSVMRGEIMEQGGLDAALSDRLNAGKELMKRHAAAESAGDRNAARITIRENGDIEVE